jgi:hypothetical protein
MASHNRTHASDRAKAIPAFPDTPTVGTATASETITAASVEFTANPKGGIATSYTVISTPGDFTATGASSPITVEGLAGATAYTFRVRANNSSGSSSYGSASNSITTIALPVVSGGTLTSDSTYYYRTFTGNGTLTVENSPIAIGALIVGGGGGGATYGAYLTGYGGGSGGVQGPSTTLSTGSYDIVIGAGGSTNAPGGSTTFHTYTSTGGTHEKAAGTPGGGTGGQPVGDSYVTAGSGTASVSVSGYPVSGTTGGGGGGTRYGGGRGAGAGSGIGTGGGGGGFGYGGDAGTGYGAGGGGKGQDSGPNVGSGGIVIVKYLKTAVA